MNSISNTLTRWVAAAALLCAAQLPAQRASSIELERAPLMPRAIASFGAAATGDGWVYVFGGHVGRAHAHSRDNVVGDFRRFNLIDGQTWQDLPDGPALQGTALVAHDGVLYRVGGMTAHNAAHDPEDLESTATVARFDPAERRWRDCTPLPEPRSSHDAFVVAGRLYVVGGWELRRAADPVWHRTAWVADLARSPLEWDALPTPPFQRRAIAIAASGSSIAVLGGLTPERGMPQTTALFDTETGVWSEGPELPGPGFGVSATTDDGTLYASGRGGRLLRLAADQGSWEPLRSMAFPRFFHRLVPGLDGEVVAFGGVCHGHTRLVERMALDDRTPRVLEWSVPFAGDARSRHVAVVDRGAVWLAGGNRNRGQHHFGVDDFSAEVWRVQLADMSVHREDDMPFHGQSMRAAVVGRSAFVLGGFGPTLVEPGGEEATVRSRAGLVEFAPRSAEWLPVAAELPSPRSKFHAEVVDSSIWLFGGNDHDPRRPKGEQTRYPLDVPVVHVDDEGVRAADSGVALPRPRSGFAAGRIGSRLYLVGGIDPDYETVTTVDVFDFETRSWSTAPAPGTSRLGGQIVVLDGRIYLAGGSARDADGDFGPVAAVEEFEPGRGWTTVVESLPFSMRHVHLLANNGRLLFVSTYEEGPNRVTVRVLDPRPARVEPGVIEAAMHR